MTYRRILVPVKGNSYDRRATELAASLADDNNTELVLVSVVEVSQRLPLEAAVPGAMNDGEEALRLAATWIQESANGKQPQVSTDLLQARSAGAAIVDEALETESDIIVMASRNHKKHGRPTVGETVPYVLKNAPCEVIVARLPPANKYDTCEWPKVDAEIQ